VLARRGFMRFLYLEALQLLGGREATLLTAAGRGKFAVPDDCTFHLYVSTAPCGTASCTRAGSKAPKAPETLHAAGEGAPPSAPQSSGEAAPPWFVKGSGDPE
ncbi:Adarb1, partial [Symbiodinium necroappetens]